MEILKVEPKDIYVTFGIYLYEVNRLLDALDKSTLSYDGENESDRLAKEALDDFFKMLNELSEGMRNES